MKSRSIDDLKIKIFADGADLAAIRALRRNPRVRGFTTNPSLMRAAGVRDYESFARAAIEAVDGLPISFEVFADDFPTMAAQAREIASWGDNVFVKIPVMNSGAQSSAPLLADLTASGIRVNVTAIMTLRQTEVTAAALNQNTAAIISVFAGRIADTGQEPDAIMRDVVQAVAGLPLAEVLWASTREIYNLFQADACGCHIITLPPALLGKLDAIGRDLEEYSRATVAEFRRDALAASYDIAVKGKAAA